MNKLLLQASRLAFLGVVGIGSTPFTELINNLQGAGDKIDIRNYAPLAANIEKTD
jgi:hypothetical protein